MLAEPDPFQRDAVVLECGPGDRVYWPESYWHCVYQPEDDRQVHASVNLTFQSNERLSDLFARIVAETLIKQLGTSNNLYKHWQEIGKELPTEIETGLDVLDKAVRSGEIRKCAEMFWMNLYRTLEREV